ncbi:hypothetical protein [Fangia hongkongensis]|uniref:hypothetical protein n=1 Tax=Fangia hongkongensis TaxID=270495 RepID=UPI00037AB418|nr:hypothetical protein [Fangia hongkongensis]MBK2123707.1 hypothetical protein [Fangia hongkongensis]
MSVYFEVEGGTVLNYRSEAENAVTGHSSSYQNQDARMFLTSFAIGDKTCSKHIVAYDGGSESTQSTKAAFIVESIRFPLIAQSQDNHVSITGYVNVEDANALKQAIDDGSKGTTEGLVVKFNGFNEKQVVLADEQGKNQTFIQAVKSDGEVQLSCQTSAIHINTGADASLQQQDGGKTRVEIDGVYAPGQNLKLHVQKGQKQNTQVYSIET